MSSENKGKHTILQKAFQTDGKSCRELIADRERLDLIENEIKRGEALIQEAERMRKEGLEIKKKAEAEKQKELIIRAAIAKFKSSDEEFIKENGENSRVTRLREGEMSGKTYVIISGEKSPKQFQVFFVAD